MVIPTVTSIRVDGVKVVIIEPPKTAKEFTDLLNWREYKNKVGLRDLVAAAGGSCGVQVIESEAA